MVADDGLPSVASGLNIGLSVSKSEDLARFGLAETHIRMALGEIARAVLVAGGHLTYGGHLRSDGYTIFLVREIERLRYHDRPFTGYVPYSEHRRMSIEAIKERISDISVLGSYVFLDADGREIDPTTGRSTDPEKVDGAIEGEALTAARMIMSGVIDGRVALGGKRNGFSGRMPGVIEETILAIRGRKPVYLAGGYGGAAGDMAAALGADPDDWLGLNGATSPHLDELREATTEHKWSLTSNGLTQDENQRLAITYRASEVASLIVLGLSRLASGS